MTDSVSQVNPAQIAECWSDDERMNFLFSAFPPTRSSNPHHWDTKMLFWKNLIEKICKRTQYGYVTWDNTFQHLSRKGKLPLGLQTVFNSLIENGELVQEFQYTQDIRSDETWVGWGMKWCVRKPASWVAGKVLSPIKSSPHKDLKVGRFILITALEKKCSTLVETYHEYMSENKFQDYHFLNIVSYSKLKELAKDTLCDDESLELALMTLRKNKILDIWSPNDDIQIDSSKEKYIKFARSSGEKKVSPFSEADIGIIKLCETKSHLNELIEKAHKEIENGAEKARTYLRNNQRNMAVNALRRKKHVQVSLAKKERSLNNVEQLLESLQQCKTDKMIFDTYKAAVAGYRDSSNGLSTEEVQSTMDDVADVLSTQADIGGALSAQISFDTEDDQDFEAELSALLGDGIGNLSNKMEGFEITERAQVFPKVPVHSPKTPCDSERTGGLSNNGQQQLAV